MNSDEVYSKTREYSDVLSTTQQSLICDWAIANNLEDIDVKLKGNYLTVEGTSTFCEVKFKRISMTVLCLQKLKDDYETKFQDGFVGFLKEEAENERI